MFLLCSKLTNIAKMSAPNRYVWITGRPTFEKKRCPANNDLNIERNMRLLTFADARASGQILGPADSFKIKTQACSISKKLNFQAAIKSAASAASRNPRGA